MNERKMSINGRSWEFWDLGESDFYKHLPCHLASSIEETVSQWINDKGKIFDTMLEINLTDAEGQWVKSLLFVRSEIHIKEASNTWSCWHIATCSEWPHIFSCLMNRTFGTNENCEDLIMPNEIRSFNYSRSFYSCYCEKEFPPDNVEPSKTRYQILLDRKE